VCNWGTFGALGNSKTPVQIGVALRPVGLLGRSIITSWWMLFVMSQHAAMWHNAPISGYNLGSHFA
jgi:hypothetical protein